MGSDVTQPDKDATTIPSVTISDLDAANEQEIDLLKRP
jgi:hypothetical protein